MIRIFYSTAFLLSMNFGFGHDLKMAIFEIYEGKTGLEISISIDREVFLQTLKADCSETMLQNEFEDAAWEYLDSHMKIFVNDQFGSFHIEEIEYGRQNMIITGSLNVSVKEVREVRMTNTCLVDSIDGHDNIMKLNLGGRLRSFRLNEKRTATTAKY